MTGSYQSSPWWDRCLAGIHKHKGQIISLDNDSILLSSFQRMGIRVAYAGFPCSRTMGNRELDMADIARLAGASRSSRCALLRWSCATPPEVTGYKPAGRTIETRIDSLGNWSPGKPGSALLRNIRKAQRSLVSVESPPSGQAMFKLYSDTVISHGGKVRYTSDYFDALREASMNTAEFRIHAVRDEAGLAAFVATATSGDCMYYLHGASDATKRDLRPMDLLFFTILQSCPGEGVNTFNFLSSPETQPGLVRYKEKWGGHSNFLYHYSLPCTLAGRVLSTMGQ